MKGQIVNRGTLADIFGVALTTIDSWTRQGCPIEQNNSGRGNEKKFNTADVAKWLRQKASDEATGTKTADIDELKRRKQQAETELSELEILTKRGEVGLVSEFVRVQSAMMTVIRQNILNVPARAVTQLLGCTDELEFKTKLRAELVIALEQASTAELVIDEDDADD